MFITNTKITEKCHSKNTHTYVYGCSSADSRDFSNKEVHHTRETVLQNALSQGKFKVAPSPGIHTSGCTGQKVQRQLIPSLHAAAKLNPSRLLEEQRMAAPLTRRFHRHVPIRVECANLIVTAGVYSERLHRGWYCCSLFSLSCCTEKYPKPHQITPILQRT